MMRAIDSLRYAVLTIHRGQNRKQNRRGQGCKQSWCVSSTVRRVSPSRGNRSLRSCDADRRAARFQYLFPEIAESLRSHPFFLTKCQGVKPRFKISAENTWQYPADTSDNKVAPKAASAPYADLNAV
jgi:hypothetical protein